MREYWVVDPRLRVIEVWHPGDVAPTIHRDEVIYRTPDGDHSARVDLSALFEGVPEVDDE